MRRFRRSILVRCLPFVLVAIMPWCCCALSVLAGLGSQASENETCVASCCCSVPDAEDGVPADDAPTGACHCVKSPWLGDQWTVPGLDIGDRPVIAAIVTEFGAHRTFDVPELAPPERPPPGLAGRRIVVRQV